VLATACEKNEAEALSRSAVVQSLQVAIPACDRLAVAADQPAWQAAGFV
jgi:hypothetical protein